MAQMRTHSPVMWNDTFIDVSWGEVNGYRASGRDKGVRRPAQVGSGRFCCI